MSAPAVVVIVQARMGSERLPGKVLMDLAGAPILSRVLDRLRQAKTPDLVVVATTVSEKDDPVADLARSHPGVAVYRGDEFDVLARYHEAARASHADIIVRVTADCPFVDGEILDRCVHALSARVPNPDYVSNVRPRTYPRGLDVEAFWSSTLETAHREATDADDREHVTRYILGRPERFRLGSVTAHEDFSHLRWTVDTQLDLDVIRAIYADLEESEGGFGYRDLIAHARRHPEIHRRNQHVVQKA